jgi:hypothetical protein
LFLYLVCPLNCSVRNGATTYDYFQSHSVSEPYANHNAKNGTRFARYVSEITGLPVDLFKLRVKDLGNELVKRGKNPDKALKPQRVAMLTNALIEEHGRAFLYANRSDYHWHNRPSKKRTDEVPLPSQSPYSTPSRTPLETPHDSDDEDDHKSTRDPISFFEALASSLSRFA